MIIDYNYKSALRSDNVKLRFVKFFKLSAILYSLLSDMTVSDDVTNG